MECYRIKPGRRIRLKDWDPADRRAFAGDKENAEKRIEALCREMDTLQEVLYAERKHKVLIVLQGMDTSGKDGTVRHLFRGMNPAGVRVANFKVPTAEELDHDYLWRVHRQAPGKGEIAIFNRSHYEDVLIVRVHALVEKKVWAQRYAQINEFERLLAEEGTAVLKFFLHIDAEEQKRRLQERLDDPQKRWKFNPGDLAERKLWPQYMRAYEDTLSRTSTAWAPWHLVPANHKWYRNLVVGSVVVEALKALSPKYPEPAGDLSRVVIE